MHHPSLRLPSCLAVCALLLSGCPFRNYDPVPRDAAPSDAAPSDAALDAPSVDAGPDASAPDAGVRDAGDVEATLEDSEYEWHDVQVDTRARTSSAGTRLVVDGSGEMWLAFVSCASDSDACSEGELVVMRGSFDSGFVEELPAPAIRVHAFDLALDADGTLVLLAASTSAYEIYRRDRSADRWSRRILPSAADADAQAPRLLLLEGRMHALLPRAADTTELVEASGSHRVLSTSASGGCLLYGVWAPDTLESLRAACVPRAGAVELQSMRASASGGSWEQTPVSALEEWAELCGAGDLADWSCAHGMRLTSFGLAPMLACAGATDARLVDQALPLRAGVGCPMVATLAPASRAVSYQHGSAGDAASAYEALVRDVDGSIWRLERIASGAPTGITFATDASGTAHVAYHLCVGTSCGHRVAVRSAR